MATSRKATRTVGQLSIIPHTPTDMLCLLIVFLDLSFVSDAARERMSGRKKETRKEKKSRKKTQDLNYASARGNRLHRPFQVMSPSIPPSRKGPQESTGKQDNLHYEKVIIMLVRK